ncbi:hypothetical protein D3C84_1039760 [compost metagenome]
MSMVCAGWSAMRALKRSMKALNSGERMPMTRPGLVQNCPQPSTTEAASSAATCSPRAFSASGRRITGLMLLISANTGIGCGRAAAMSHSARPPCREPVKPTAWIAGCLTRSAPTALP